MSFERGAEVNFPTKFGDFKLVSYADKNTERCHIALIFGKPKDNALVRVHSECLTGDALYSMRCDCGEQLKKAFEIISKEGNGIIIYLRQEGRGIGLLNKIKAYHLQDKGLDTVEANHQLGFRADERDYKIAADILKDLGITKIRLLTNNPDKIKGLNGSIAVSERIPLVISANKYNNIYLKTKREKLGHSI
ncbi:MAG: GTP cyclohydrolase II [Candidatus Woesearchaeota archaeon]|nr:GTP cyclohydrolase II [Candidatus Woesearchaeota archaeon]